MWDFGIEPIDEHAVTSLRETRDQGLPGVPSRAWAANRYVPIVPEAIQPPPANMAITPELAADWISTLPSAASLYTHSTVPIISLSGEDLQAVLRNMPVGAEPVGPFTLNLAEVFYAVMEGAEF